MKFSIVIGNPPYNNDIYIDFVKLGIKYSKILCSMITPAKWQAKPNVLNWEFRKTVVPYMKKIVYYPDAGDIFNIRLHGGVSYYTIVKNVVAMASIKNVCDRVKAFNSDGKFENRELASNMLNSNSINDKLVIDNDVKYNICKKVGVFDNNFESLNIGAVPIKDYYNAFSTSVNADSGGKVIPHTYNKSGSLTMLPPFYITQDAIQKTADTICFFTSPNKSETESFVSYVNTKFVRFMLLMRFCTYHNNNNGCWVFVPHPIKFDHIFSDEELYNKFNLDINERALIESVISSR